MTEHAGARYILTIDVGTSSIRVTLVDEQARIVPEPSSRRPFPLKTTPDGGAEADADCIVETIVSSVDEVVGQLGGRAHRICAVAMATLVSNILGVDQHWRPLTPAYLWGDTRNLAEADELRQRHDELAVLERTGCPIHPSYLPARLLWLQRHYSSVVQQVHRWVTLGELIAVRLTGDDRVSHSVAAWSGLLNRRTLHWDGEWLASLDIEPARLGPIGAADQPGGTLRPEFAARWPALTRAAWFPAIGDGAAANLGSGCIGASRVALTIGTSSALRAALPGEIPAIPWGLWLYRVDQRYSLLGGALSEGGNLINWLEAVLQTGDYQRLDRAVAMVPPDNHGLTVLPFITGERSPGWAAGAGATFSGIRLTTTATDLVRAAMEAIAYRAYLIDQLLGRMVEPDHVLVASGGALVRSPTWMQIIADVMERPLIALAERETTSRGIAILALAALGFLPEVGAAASPQGRRYEPITGHRERYAAAIARQQTLYRALVGEPRHPLGATYRISSGAS